jgi:hypothetical protein
MIKVKITDIKTNPNNPRIIRDEKYKKLLKSIQEFPDMLNKRPIVAFTDKDGKYVVLGGNMRLKALKELKYKEVPIIVADEWTEEQKHEFLIKDNVGFGEWDWDSLANEWDVEKLEDWGLDIPNWSAGLDVNNMTEEDIDIEEEFDAIGITKDIKRVTFIFDSERQAEEYLTNLELKIDKKGAAWQVNLSTVYI